MRGVIGWNRHRGTNGGTVMDEDRLAGRLGISHRYGPWTCSSGQPFAAQ
jgi:hypothetical protein